MLGEIGVIFNIPQPFTVRTKRLSEVIRISHNHFKQLVEPLSEDGKIIVSNFLQNLKSLKEDELKEMPFVTELLGETNIEATTSTDELQNRDGPSLEAKTSASAAVARSPAGSEEVPKAVEELAAWMEMEVGSDSMEVHEEMMAEAVRAGIKPTELEALFNEAEIAKEAASERLSEQDQREVRVEPRVCFYWDKHGRLYVGYGSTPKLDDIEDKRWIQPPRALGRVLQDVPNKAKCDLVKWFRVSGAWRSVSSDPLPVELAIPTEFRERPKNIRNPTADELSWDFALSQRPSGDRPQEEGEKSLIPCKKQKEEVPPARATSGALSLEAPIAATPLSERQPCSLDDLCREFVIMDAETPRGKPFFGRDRTKSRVPSYINRAIANLPRAWTIDLDAVAARRGNDATRALFAPALQTATMAAQVTRESELRPSVPKLKAELEESRKLNGELTDRVVKMEIESLDAAKRASLQVDQLVQANNRLKCELIEARESYVAMMKEFSGELMLARSLAETARAEATQVAERVAAAEARAEKMAEELAAKASELERERAELERERAESAANASELERVRAVLAGKEAQEEEDKDDPWKDMTHAAECAYYMAYADALRTAKEGGMDVGPLLKTSKAYATARPLHPEFDIPILDLSTKYGIDLSWYSRFDRLIQPNVVEVGTLAIVSCPLVAILLDLHLLFLSFDPCGRVDLHDLDRTILYNKNHFLVHGSKVNFHPNSPIVKLINGKHGDFVYHGSLHFWK
ncbi:hypothetical protein OROHE_006224 [Orobanche hederae]